jgi:hypothetical protein
MPNLANPLPPLDQQYEESFRPMIVCLCGSTRFKAEFEAANEVETLAGKIVLSVGFFAGMLTDAGRRERLTPEVKLALDELHVQKIEIADEVLVVNVDGYIGASTRREIWYAAMRNKPIRWVFKMELDRQEIISWFESWETWHAARMLAANA